VADAQIEAALGLAEAATGRLLDALADVDDAWCRAPSLLPDWSRGHVLTHLARNADALARLARATADGRAVSMYGPEGAREADIEAGAGRDAATLVDDVRTSAARLSDTCRTVPDTVWDEVREWRPGRSQPLRTIPVARLVEAEAHRVDLGAGYVPADWPASSCNLLLSTALTRLAGAPSPPLLRVHPDGQPPRGSDEPEAPTVSGPIHELVWWLMGRDDGSRLSCTGPLPDLPAAWA